MKQRFALETYPDEIGLQLFSDWSAASGGGFDTGAVGST